MSFRKTSKSYESNRSLVILTTKANESLDGAQRFLQTRGWNVEVVAGKLNKAIAVCAALEPDYLFISIESLPTGNFSDLYRALKKSFHVILFCEKFSMHSLQRLRELDTPDVLTTALSGPNIERLINKLERDDNTIPIPSLVASRMDDLAYVDINRLSRATATVLEQVCQPGEMPKKYLRTKATYQCFSIKTARISGYIVVATAGEMKHDFTLRLKRHLSEMLGLQQDFFRVGEMHAVDFKEVGFEKLAGHLGEFFNKAFHLGNEVAISFFRSPDIDVKVSDSTLDGYMRMSLADVSESAPLEFDLYVYMPLNKRFVLYRRAGGHLETEQKTTLEFHGINEVHFKKEALKSVHEHKTKAFIKDLIWNYRQDITEMTAV